MSTRIVDKVTRSRGRPERRTAYERAKKDLHGELIRSLDLAAIPTMDKAEVAADLRNILTVMVDERGLAITADDEVRLVEEILDEVLGYGPLERLLRANDVSDILVNGPYNVWAERNGRLAKTDVQFRDDDHLLHVINRIVGAVGRRVDEATPMVDARLPDGSRVNAVIRPIALDGPLVSIRRFGRDPLRREDLVRFGACPDVVMEMLGRCVRTGMNVLISGGTGSGKTTFLNVLSSFIPEDERIVTIEDAAELRLQQPHVARMETRPANLEGKGEVPARALVRNALRMRPDRIIVGEIRGEESIDMLQAMNTGHDGSLSTVHANSPTHALGRLETMVGLDLGNLPGPAIRRMISDAVDLIVQIARLTDGKRRVTSIAQVLGLDGDEIVSQEIFRFRQTDIDPDGAVRGVFESTGVIPSFAERLRAHGHPLPTGATRIREEVQAWPPSQPRSSSSASCWRRCSPLAATTRCESPAVPSSADASAPHAAWAVCRDGVPARWRVRSGRSVAGCTRCACRPDAPRRPRSSWAAWRCSRSPASRSRRGSWTGRVSWAAPCSGSCRC
jgi:pilus assembly protein CpaF